MSVNTGGWLSFGAGAFNRERSMAPAPRRSVTHTSIAELRRMALAPFEDLRARDVKEEIACEIS